MTVLTGQQIDDARRLTLRAMLKLELLGIKKSRGPTAYATLKAVYGYKGTRDNVLVQLDAWRESLLALPINISLSGQNGSAQSQTQPTQGETNA